MMRSKRQRLEADRHRPPERRSQDILPSKAIEMSPHIRDYPAFGARLEVYRTYIGATFLLLYPVLILVLRCGSILTTDKQRVPLAKGGEPHRDDGSGPSLVPLVPEVDQRAFR